MMVRVRMVGVRMMALQMMVARTRRAVLGLSLALGLMACGSDGSSDPADGGSSTGDAQATDTQSNPDTDSGAITPPSTYAFESRFVAGESSVSYSGQTARQMLIEELKTYIGTLDAQIDGGTFEPTADGDVVAALDFYFRFDSASDGSTPLRLTTTPALAQATFDDISTDKDLVGKIAGNDTATDHTDWSTGFVGWSDATIATDGGSITNPEGLVRAFFEQIEALALLRAQGNQPTGPDGEALPVYVSAEGLDLQQLTQKFLIMAINFSQGADDYLDDDVDGKGLKASNAAPESGAHSALEHAWDEGFGYFGAARDYAAYTDDEIAVKGGRDDWQGYHDSDGDGAIDLKSEYNFGASQNAAKRDRGSVVATDFTGDAMTAFLTGRAIIAAADGELTADQMTALVAQRDAAIGAWEKAIAATVVHYINETVVHLDAIGGDSWDFLAYAKGWSEAKGFALGFQFNRRSPLSAEQFAMLHTKLGDRPVSPKAEATAIAAYRAGLLEARGILAQAYGFDAANVGDDNGQNGW